MDDDEELRMLRARAYGPSADIHLDGAALRRLRELEAAAAPAARPDAPRPAAPSAPMTDPPDPAAPEDDRTADEEEPATTAGRPRARFRRGLVAGAASVALLVSAGIGAAVNAALSPQHPTPGVELVRTVGIDPDFSWPSFFPEPGSLRAIGFSDLAGITVVAIPPSSAAARGWCIFTYETARLDPTSDAYEGDTEQACEGRPFPASVVIDLDRAPRSLREAFPDDSALQLVLDAEQREVLVYAGRTS
ncbi:hypothetical protein ACIQLJ_02965 [Microbacterium sp. NPDC091313]